MGVVVGLVRPSLASCFSSEVLTEWETRRPIGWLACLHLLPPIPPSYSSDVSKKKKKRSEERQDRVTREYRQTLRIYTALLQGADTLCIFMHVLMYRYLDSLKRYCSRSSRVCVCLFSYSYFHIHSGEHLDLHSFLQYWHLESMNYIWFCH